MLDKLVIIDGQKFRVMYEKASTITIQRMGTNEILETPATCNVTYYNKLNADGTPNQRSEYHSALFSGDYQNVNYVHLIQPSANRPGETLPFEMDTHLFTIAGAAALRYDVEIETFFGEQNLMGNILIQEYSPELV